MQGGIIMDEKFCDYFDRWVKEFKEGNIREVTLDKYYCTSKALRKIAPALMMSELDRTAYQRILNVYGETHEKTTALDFHHHLKACISDARNNGDLKNDPTYKVAVKAMASREKKPKFLSQFEVQLLVKSLNLDGKLGYDHLLFLIIKTGLRFSEALGLTRKDFDFAAQTITVNKTWGYKKGSGAQFEPTKNASSIRTIQVDWITLQKFSDLIKDIPENEPIFRYGRQYSMCNSCANDILEAKCKQLGIPVISVHGLRHTHASLLLAAGVSIASVSKRLGHSNMSTTQNIYLHIIRELENKDNALAVSSMLNIG
jgi:integrase